MVALTHSTPDANLVDALGRLGFDIGDPVKRSCGAWSQVAHPEGEATHDGAGSSFRGSANRHAFGRSLVEPRGIEPLTSSLRTRRSTI